MRSRRLLLIVILPMVRMPRASALAQGQPVVLSVAFPPESAANFRLNAGAAIA